MYDVVGGGFARYSTDAHWLVPHFEKMLYDNAQLASAYLHAWLVTGDASFSRVCEDTLDFTLRELTVRRLFYDLMQRRRREGVISFKMKSARQSALKRLNSSPSP
jgi:uncharacterized protein YyaL (SSP411 family)